jgi:hypothetical protein
MKSSGAVPGSLALYSVRFSAREGHYKLLTKVVQHPADGAGFAGWKQGPFRLS